MSPTGPPACVKVASATPAFNPALTWTSARLLVRTETVKPLKDGETPPPEPAGSQPMASISVRSLADTGSSRPEDANASNGSSVTEDAQSPVSPKELVLNAPRSEIP